MSRFVLSRNVYKIQTKCEMTSNAKVEDEGCVRRLVSFVYVPFLFLSFLCCSCSWCTLQPTRFGSLRDDHNGAFLHPLWETRPANVEEKTKVR